jgi:hypothetical protein
MLIFSQRSSINSYYQILSVVLILMARDNPKVDSWFLGGNVFISLKLSLHSTV